jgi:hypothetical protein
LQKNQEAMEKDSIHRLPVRSEKAGARPATGLTITQILQKSFELGFYYQTAAWNRNVPKLCTQLSKKRLLTASFGLLDCVGDVSIKKFV